MYWSRCWTLKFKVGDEVYARSTDYRIGIFVEFISTNQDNVALKLKSLTMEESVSFALARLTALQAIIGRAKLKKG